MALHFLDHHHHYQLAVVQPVLGWYDPNWQQTLQRTNHKGSQNLKITIQPKHTQ